jgi:hypothetical protein
MNLVKSLLVIALHLVRHNLTTTFFRGGTLLLLILIVAPTSFFTISRWGACLWTNLNLGGNRKKRKEPSNSSKQMSTYLILAEFSDSADPSKSSWRQPRRSDPSLVGGEADVGGMGSRRGTWTHQVRRPRTWAWRRRPPGGTSRARRLETWAEKASPYGILTVRYADDGKQPGVAPAERGNRGRPQRRQGAGNEGGVTKMKNTLEK